MLCLCKVAWQGDWTRILVSCVALFFITSFFQVDVPWFSSSDFHIGTNCPHAESFETCLPLPALAGPSCISGGVTVEMNRVPS